MLNDRSSLLAYLRTRRSCRPRDLVDPGPDESQLRDMLSIAARTPDHGKLAPWRFIHVRREDRDSFGDMLEQAYLADKSDAGRLEIEAAHRFAHQAPTLIITLSRPVPDSKIPVWEQQLSCGAACMNLLHAANACGFAAGWVTGWAAYSPHVLRGIGAGEQDRIAGFVFIGTPSAPLEERIRPELSSVARDWSPRG